MVNSPVCENNRPELRQVRAGVLLAGKLLKDRGRAKLPGRILFHLSLLPKPLYNR